LFFNIIGKYFEIIKFNKKLKKVVKPVNFDLTIYDCNNHVTGAKHIENKNTAKIIEIIQIKYFYKYNNKNIEK